MSHICRWFGKSPRVAPAIAVATFFILSFGYGTAVVLLRGLGDHIATVGFVLLLVWAMAVLIGLVHRQSATGAKLFLVVSTVFATHSGIMVATWLSGASETYLWVPDSVNHHVPLAKQFMMALKADSFSPMLDWLKQSDGPLTHGLSGLCFLLFGVGAHATGVALLFFKMTATGLVYCLGRDLFGEKKYGLVAATIYGLMPTILFYSISYYKEAAVQMLVAGVLWGMTAIFSFRRSVVIIGLICAVFLMRERFYLLPVVVVPALLISLAQLVRGRIVQSSGRIGLVVAVTGLLGLFYAVYDKQYLIMDLPKILRLTRENLISLPDVDPRFNGDLFFPLAVIKSFFTPFFGLRKFEMFFDFSFLLIWGSFVHQAVSFLSAVAGWRSLRDGWSKHLMFWGPILILLFALAYLAPYSGRQRDSLYPVIAVYAAAAICRKFSIADAGRIRKT
jgi:hypothetical protein